VLLEIYLFESGSVATRFIDAFVRAASHGVKVKLLLDDFGAEPGRRGEADDREEDSDGSACVGHG